MKAKIAFEFKDNWQNFEYSSRYLDALAAVVHVQGPCAAVLKYEGKFYLSYNSSITTQNQKRLELVNSILTSEKPLKEKTELLLGSYLIFNPDFKEFIKLDKRCLAGDFKTYFEGFISLIQDSLRVVDRSIKNNCSFDYNYLKKVSEEYYKIFSFKDQGNLKDHIDIFLRPLQDCVKLCFYLKVNKMKVIPLENKCNFHAEYNITLNFPKTSLLNKDEDYIGISKLSCGYCHKYLQESVYFHRGTHGVCDDQWSMGFQSERFKNLINTKEIDKQEDIPKQYRKLSIDLFEINSQEFSELNNIKKEFFSSSYQPKIAGDHIDMDDG